MKQPKPQRNLRTVKILNDNSSRERQNLIKIIVAYCMHTCSQLLMIILQQEWKQHFTPVRCTSASTDVRTNTFQLSAKAPLSHFKIGTIASAISRRGCSDLSLIFDTWSKEILAISLTFVWHIIFYFPLKISKLCFLFFYITMQFMFDVLYGFYSIRA